jgi:hypothetical protein
MIQVRISVSQVSGLWFLHGSGHSGHRLAALTFMPSMVRLMSGSLHAG